MFIGNTSTFWSKSMKHFMFSENSGHVWWKKKRSIQALDGQDRIRMPICGQYELVLHVLFGQNQQDIPFLRGNTSWWFVEARNLVFHQRRLVKIRKKTSHFSCVVKWGVLLCTVCSVACYAVDKRIPCWPGETMTTGYKSERKDSNQQWAWYTG